MKLFRTLFLLLLCVMLPISGLAASGMVGECPMQQTVATQDGGDMSAAGLPCDSMKPSQASKSKAGLCKMTAQCQFGSLYHPAASAPVVRRAVPGNRVTFHYVQSLSIRAPDGLWRPPRSL